MAETSKTNFFNTNCVKFGRNERHVPELSDKKQQNKNSLNNKKEETLPEEEFKTSSFVDRSAQLSASLHSLALSNMINLRKSEVLKFQINNFIDKKSGLKTEIINPFVKKD